MWTVTFSTASKFASKFCRKQSFFYPNQQPFNNVEPYERITLRALFFAQCPYKFSSFLDLKNDCSRFRLFALMTVSILFFGICLLLESVPPSKFCKVEYNIMENLKFSTGVSVDHIYAVRGSSSFEPFFLGVLSIVHTKCLWCATRLQPSCYDHCVCNYNKDTYFAPCNAHILQLLVNSNFIFFKLTLLHDTLYMRVNCVWEKEQGRMRLKKVQTCVAYAISHTHISKNCQRSCLTIHLNTIMLERV